MRHRAPISPHKHCCRIGEAKNWGQVALMLVVLALGQLPLFADVTDYVARFPMDSEGYGFPVSMEPQGGKFVPSIIPGGNEAYRFYGNDLIAIPNHESINTYTGLREQYSISLWFNAETVTSFEGEQVLYEQGDPRSGFVIYLNEGTLYAGALSLDNNQPPWLLDQNYPPCWLAVSSIERNKLYHVAFILDATLGTLKLYLNGELRGKGWSKPIAPHGGIGVGGVYHGMRFATGHFTNYTDMNYFRGVIDDVRLYDYALDPAQIKEIYDTYYIDTNNSINARFAKAFGHQNIVNAYSSMVIGQYNDGSYDDSGFIWRPQDTLFEIGYGVLMDANGTPDDFSDDTVDRKNAMTVFKDAHIEMGVQLGSPSEQVSALVITETGDVVLGKHQGDIPAGSFSD